MRRNDICRAAVAAFCGLALAAPVSEAALESCPAQPVAQVFLPWGDPASRMNLLKRANIARGV